MASLLPLSVLKARLHIPAADLQDDEVLEFALEVASQAVMDYADRDFTVQASGASATPRDFEYDGSGWLDITDCTDIEEVAFDDRILNFEDWHAHPVDKIVKSYIILHDNYYGIGSPEMGFKRNLDRIAFVPITPEFVTVTAKWGWPEVPFPVQQAVLWTAVALNEDPKPYMNESIAGYSRTRFAPDFTLPPRAQAILQPYVRIKV